MIFLKNTKYVDTLKATKWYTNIDLKIIKSRVKIKIENYLCTNLIHIFKNKYFKPFFFKRLLYLDIFFVIYKFLKPFYYFFKKISKKIDFMFFLF